MSEQRGIFITGASTGLGNAATRLFASKGWRVVATMRRPEAATELASIAGVELLPLDVLAPEQIAQAARRATEGGRIDVLFNNAGYGLSGPLEGATDEQLTTQINTNLLGAIRTAQAFIPYFRERRGGLIINTSSIGGFITSPFYSVYHATKWALEGWSESLAFELNLLGIGVKTISPGLIKTDFFGRSLAIAQHPAYDDAFNKVMNMFRAPEVVQAGSTAEQIAEVVYEAATDGKSQLRYLAGADAKALHAQRLAVGDEAFRNAFRQQLFGE